MEGRRLRRECESRDAHGVCPRREPVQPIRAIGIDEGTEARSTEMDDGARGGTTLRVRHAAANCSLRCQQGGYDKEDDD